MNTNIYSNTTCFNNLPEELQTKILTELLSSDGLEEMALVSKKMRNLSLKVFKDWISDSAIFLKKMWIFDTAAEAVDYISKHHLPRADLYKCRDVTDKDLEKLSQNCPNLIHLTLHPSKTDNQLKDYPLEKFKNLNSLDLYDHNLDEGKLSDKLPQLTRLKKLLICEPKHLTDKFTETLTKLVGLKSICLDYCHEITEDAFAVALSKMTHLTDIHFGRCPQISGKKMAALGLNVDRYY